MGDSQTEGAGDGTAGVNDLLRPDFDRGRDRAAPRGGLHAGPLGHQRIAEALAEVLELPGSSSGRAESLPQDPARQGAVAAVAAELRWVYGFLAPWLLRRVTGTSSGEGRVAKRPSLAPVAASALDSPV